MPIEGELLTAIARQERDLIFDRFDENTAWILGQYLHDLAYREGWPLVIDILFFSRRLFFSALPGSSPDNVEWARKKANVVERFHKSSYAIGLQNQRAGTGLAETYGLLPGDYADHGGAFPIRLVGCTVAGTAVVSGLPQYDDHMIVVRGICEVLRVDWTRYTLPAISNDTGLCEEWNW